MKVTYYSLMIYDALHLLENGEITVTISSSKKKTQTLMFSSITTNIYILSPSTSLYCLIANLE